MPGPTAPGNARCEAGVGVRARRTEPLKGWITLRSGPRVVNAETKARMKDVLNDIQTGKFTSEWMQEYRSGAARFKGIRRRNDAHQIEEVGEKLRGMMPWIKAGALVDKSKN